MPNKEAIREWVDTLRSGEYQQATGCLKTYDDETHGPKHCCLGVVTEEYRKIGELFEYTLGEDSLEIDPEDVLYLDIVNRFQTCFIEKASNLIASARKVKYIANKDNLPPSVAEYLGTEDSPKVTITYNDLKNEVYQGRINQSALDYLMNDYVDDGDKDRESFDPDEEFDISLANLNDSGVPFPVIADIIENNYLK